MGSGETSDYPNLVVEWLPAEGANATNGTWVDITEYVQTFSTKRGRQYELDQFQAGQCTLDLVATTRLFDPENTAGTYFGQLVPMRQIRLTSRWSGTTYSMFRGYVTDWGQTIVDDKLFKTTVTARDAFLRLEQKKLPSSAWALEVVQDDPSLWFRLGETDTPRVTDSSDGGNYGLYDNVTQGAAGLVPNDADGAVEIGHSTDERVTIQNPSLISGYPFTIEAMFQADAADEYRVIFSGLKNQNTVSTDGLTIALLQDDDILGGSGGQLHCRFDSSSGGGRYLRSAQQYDDGFAHHVAVVCTNSGSHSMYVDGVSDFSVTSAGHPAWWTTAANGYTVGNFIDVVGGDFGFHGTIDEVLVFPTALSAGTIAQHALAAKTGWDGDDTGTRVTRFLNAIGWPTELRDIDTGISTLGPAQWSAGDSALQVMQAWADTELGMFFVDADGKIVWKSRHAPLLDAASVTSQATFSDGHAASGVLVDDIVLTRDEAFIRNPVQASRAGGVSVVATDTTYVEKYGDRTWASPETQDQKDSAVRDRAIWLLARYKELGTRLESVTLRPRRNPSVLWPQALGRLIGDRVTIKRTPLGFDNEISKDFIVESVEHSGRPLDWTTRFSGSPVDPNVGSYLVLNDANQGLLDTGRLAY